ncbi:MAG: archaellin/type IV pilin N-terminal domain-containing protein, partial [Candidatus Aenigmatarchaeota archaeon]
TPIIAIIILLLITVALAGTAWTFLQGYLGIYTQKNFDVALDGGAYCTNVATFNTIRVLATNTGTTALEVADFIIHDIDGAPITLVAANFPVLTGTAATIISDNNAGAGYAVGAHAVDIGTAGNVKHFTVYC